MFSVIIPLYNKENYIKKALDSVLCQSFQDFELIVVDDGSTDNSLSIVKQYTDKRIVILNQSNSGVSLARNNGVQLAKFDFITFLDGDDWWHSDFLMEMAEIIEDFPEAGIYGSKYFWVKNGKQKASLNHQPPNFKGYIDYIEAYTFAWWMPLTSISVVIKKSVFYEMNGFKSYLKFGEDFDLWIRVALSHKVAYTNKPLAFYNQDVDRTNRALGKKNRNKGEHFIFNLEYLSEAEKNNDRLKHLLDGLRVRALMNYYLDENGKSQIANELNKINFSKQPMYYNFIYKSPIMIVKLYFFIKKIGSHIKQFLIKSKIFL